MNKQRVVHAALTAVALAAAVPLAGAATTWTSSDCTASGSGSGNSYICGSGTGAMTAQAWSTTGSGGTYRTATVTRWDGGFGVNNGGSSEGSSPQHALDNQNNTDLIGLSFAQRVTLSSLKLGWVHNDSDLSVLAYTGASAPSSLTGFSAATLLGAGSGWSLVGNYANVGTNTKTINTGDASSSWWLVSAYNSNFGSGTGLGGGNDYVKLLSVAGTPEEPPGVPEPGTLALAGVALLGAWRLRRKGKASPTA